MKQMNKNISKLQLITQELEDRSHLQQIEMALEGGCQWVQLRIKDKGADEVLELAAKARAITEKFGATLVINDFPEIAKAVKADGVHLGKNDAAPKDVRQFLGEDYIIGATANTFYDIQNLVAQPIDYLGVGPYKFTNTKKNLSPILGLEGYKTIVAQCRAAKIEIPMVAIGSVGVSDVQDLLKLGMFGVAVSSAISKSQEPANSTRQLLETIMKNQTALVE